MSSIELIPIAVAITLEKPDHPLVNVIKAEVESLNFVVLENRAMSAEFRQQTLSRVCKGLTSQAFYETCVRKSKAFFLDTLRFKIFFICFKIFFNTLQRGCPSNACLTGPSRSYVGYH
jgi:hypothetical protein